MDAYIAICKRRRIIRVKDAKFVENHTQDHLVFVADLSLDESNHFGFDIVGQCRIFDAIMSIIWSRISQFQETFGIPYCTTDLLFGGSSSEGNIVFGAVFGIARDDELLCFEESWQDTAYSLAGISSIYVCCPRVVSDVCKHSK